MVSQDTYRLLMENIVEGILALNANWEVVYLNEVAGKILERDPDSLVGKNLWAEFPGAINGEFYTAYHTAFATQQTITIEGYSERRDKWVHASIYPSPIGICIYFHDVTNQRKAEMKAKESEDKFHLLIDRVTDAFIALDKNFCYTYANKQAGEMAHRDPASLIGKNVWKEFPEAVGSATYKAFCKAMQEQHYESNIDYFAPFDLWFEYHIYPSPEGISVFIKDISEKIKLEQQLNEQQRCAQIKTIAIALEAQEKERTNIGRELHDNVNQIIVATKIMLSYASENPEEFPSLVPQLIANLESAIAENRKIAHELVAPEFNKGSLVDELAHLIHHMIEPTGIKVKLIVSHFNERILDAEQKLAVYRVAQEQCTNIIKYSSANNVYFTLVTSTDCFTMTISDDGQGMAPGKSTKGIGLRNIASRVSIFNGSMQVQSFPDDGFKLIIKIPLTHGTAEVFRIPA